MSPFHVLWNVGFRYDLKSWYFPPYVYFYFIIGGDNSVQQFNINYYVLHQQYLFLIASQFENASHSSVCE